MTLGPETSYRVRGGAPLHGTVFVQGAKNAALKMIAASLLTGNGHTVLRNVPPIEDVRRAVELAEAVGAVVEFHETERTLVVDASNLTSPVLPAEIARRFRGSVLFVPALLHRFGEAVIEGVGGCNLGNRNLDFHYRGFARLGAVVDEGDTTIRIKASKLQGAHLYLDTPSHTGTENLIMAACLAPGRTVIDNTAQEPEVLDVIAFLTKMGARITGGGTGFITVHGVDELTAVEHTVMADRIDAMELSNFVRAVIQAEQLGISLGRILRVQAADTRNRRQAAAEEKAMKAPIKMLFPTVGFIFPAMFIVVLGPAMLNILQVFK